MIYEHVEGYLTQFPKTFVALLLKFIWDLFSFFCLGHHSKAIMRKPDDFYQYGSGILERRYFYIDWGEKRTMINGIPWKMVWKTL